MGKAVKTYLMIIPIDPALMLKIDSPEARYEKRITPEKIFRVSQE